MPETKTATFVRNVTGWQSDARLYRLSEPLVEHETVIVSAVSNEFGLETYIFGCDADGNDADFVELPGSFKGDADHALALEYAGYAVA